MCRYNLGGPEESFPGRLLGSLRLSFLFFTKGSLHLVESRTGEPSPLSENREILYDSIAKYQIKANRDFADAGCPIRDSKTCHVFPKLLNPSLQCHGRPAKTISPPYAHTLAALAMNKVLSPSLYSSQTCRGNDVVVIEFAKVFESLTCALRWP